jgi:hypothetical protein
VPTSWYTMLLCSRLKFGGLLLPVGSNEASASAHTQCHAHRFLLMESDFLMEQH